VSETSGPPPAPHAAADGNAAATVAAPARATIYEVARLAGVSPSTVSRVINGKEGVSDATRARVDAVVSDLAYRPTGAAAALRRQSAGTILVAVPDVRNPFYAELVHDLEAEARAHDLQTLVLNTGRRPALERQAIDLARRRVADGVILSDFQSTEVVADLVRRRVPFIMVGSDTPLAGVTVVETDDRVGGYLVGEHLAALGHRRVIMFHEAEEEFSADRFAGASRALRDRFGADAALVPYPPPLADGEWVRGFWRKAEEVHATAVFAANDLIAVEFMAALRHHLPGALPGLSLVGYDGTLLSEVADLATVAQPIDEMAKTAVRELLARLRGESVAARRIMLEPRWIGRASAKPAPQSVESVKEEGLP
jgi:LacI family transcriptional regulator